MAVLSPGDRAQMWGDMLVADAESRASRVGAVAVAVFQAIGSALDLYSDDYADASVESFRLLDMGGLLERGELRQAFEEIDVEDRSAQALAFVLANQLRDVATRQEVEGEVRERALELVELCARRPRRALGRRTR